MDTQNKTQTTTNKNRAAIIAAALGAALCLVLAPLLTPQADASLSNGHMCIMAKSTTDPEIEGMAGNCKPEASVPEAPAERPVSIDWSQTYFVPSAEEPGLWEARVFIRTTRDTPVGYYTAGKLVVTDNNPSGHAVPWTIRFSQFEADPVFEVCLLDPATGARSQCERVDISNYLDA